MSQIKDERVQATGGFFASSQEQQVRMRICELNDKLKAAELTKDERTEYLRLVTFLPDT
jgi:hypothetical protein